jgi:hypothetical protein
VKVRLLLDEDVHFSLAIALRKRGFEVLHVQELERKGMTDREQLNFAVVNERCLFSFNVKDFVILHNEYMKSDQEHFGIIVSKQLPIGETLKRLLRLLQIHDQTSIKNRLEFL